ncbi:hypothetical protein L218DRAFT_929000 [Marasmius fiardii PR-910]|nr:hypothetical protein L218DRAFT_929000 [Marasmius fiardii PR-910]
MLFTSASLPLHHDREHSSLSRRVGFEQEKPSVWNRFRQYVGKLAYIAIHAPTGSPSDGLGGDGTESTTSTSAFIAAQKQITAEKDGEDWKVDEVVVTGEDVDRWKRLGSERDTTTGGTPGQSDNGSVRNNRTRDTPSSQGGNIYHPPSLRSKAKYVWSYVENFFFPTFEDEHAESDFKKQNWYSTKAIAFYASLYLVLNWVLYLALNQESTEQQRYAQVVYYGGLTFLTVPLPFFIAADVPLKYPIPFQIWFTIAVWWCGVTEIIQMKLCHFFNPQNHCHRKDFLAMMYYITAVPAMMMFVIPHRLPSFTMMVIVLILISTCIMPDQNIFARNLISYILFSTFFQVLHYNKEITERRLYLLNNQLKVAYKAQQKAQMAQSRASQAKRRFASYIFHEVRVPLNNAAIAFHNLTTNHAFGDRVFKPHVEDVIALEVSLATVQQVLNDSLDLEKMDAGHFDINPRPFPLHSVIRSTLAPLIVSAAAKKLDLRINLDERIDKLTHRMMIEETGHKEWHGGEKESSRQPHQLDSPLPPEYSTPPSPSLARSRPFEATDYAGSPPKMERKRSSSSMHSPKSRHRYPRTESYMSAMSNIPPGLTDSRGAGELWVVGDEVRLRQVLTNLVSNAVKFTPEGAGDGITFSTSLVTSVPATLTMSDDGNLALPEGRTRPGSKDGRASREGRERDGKQDILVLRMEITDSGPGIKPSDLVDNQLFQPFAQTRVGKLSKNSTGLGLAIVRQIVSLSGGRLGVQSQRGRGATFWVELSYPIAKLQEVEEGMKSFSSPSSFHRISSTDSKNLWPMGAFAEDLNQPVLAGSMNSSSPPLQPPPAFTPLTEISETTVVNACDPMDPCPPEQLTTSPPLSLQSGISGDLHESSPGTGNNEALLVLVVDDDPITRKMMSRWLSLRGCVVHTAKDGKECLDKLLSPEAPKYDFVSLDNYMPGMTGEEAVKEIRRVGRHDIFVIGCTGNALTDDQKSYLAAGADHVLTKPINFKIMEQILSTARKRRLDPDADS